MKNWLIVILLLTFTATAWSQGGSAFGIKGGLTMGFQKWNDFQQQPLFRYHGIFFLESLDDNCLFAQAGYHVKGSALRYLNFTNPINNNIYRAPTQNFQFKNVSLTLGFKKKHQLGRGDAKGYYLFGLRGDYTIGTNLDRYDETYFLNTTFPTDQWVRKLNYGATLGGGFEIPFGELVGGIVEFTFNPDMSKQYYQPAISNVYDPYTGTNRNVAERKITNITAELTLGLRFLRVVEYVD